MSVANQPLKGLTVLDLGQMYNGSYCGMLLALHGARVIKIEPLRGEALRARSDSPGTRHRLYLVNSSKEGLALNLKEEAGRDLFRKLAAEADVIIENFSPGTMSKIGIDPADLLAANSRLIYACSTGYGSGGIYSDYPAMDLTVQAMTGTMATTGTDTSGPLKTGPAGADFLSGTHLLSAVLLAIIQRSITGHGQYIEVAMADAVIPSLATSIAYQLGTNKEPPRTANRHSSLAYAPYNVYATRDGHIAIFCVADSHWAGLCRVMGRPDLSRDPRLDNLRKRANAIDEIDEIVGHWAKSLGRDEAFRLLLEADVPSAPVLSLSEVLTDPHFRARGMLVPTKHPTDGDLLLLGSPLHLSSPPPMQPQPAPALGGHTNSILGELGLDKDEVQRLRSAGIVG